MIISPDRPLNRGINLFNKHYLFFTHIINSHFSITDLNNSISFNLLWINGRLHFYFLSLDMVLLSWERSFAWPLMRPV